MALNNVLYYSTLREREKNMASIAMCQDNKCPSQYRCLRHFCSGTRPDYVQQKYIKVSRHPEMSFCELFLDKEAKP
jgi:hypothetical protein